MIYQPMLDDLQRSGLLPQDINAVASAATFGSGPSGYSIPYHYPDGRPHPMMARTRLLPPVDGKKYTQPSSAALVAAGHPATDATYPYLAPKALGGQNWLTLAASQGGPIRWVLTEGEKKAAAGCKFLLRPVIGIGGCANGVVKNGAGIRQLHPVLTALFRAGDTVEVVFDADIETNADVELAGGTLRRALLSIGITPSFVRLPAKLGLDDWLLTQPQANVAAAYDALPRYDGVGLKEDVVTLSHHMGFLTNDKGIPHPVGYNVMQAIRHHERYEGNFWYDVIANTLYEKVTDGTDKPVTDAFAEQEMRWFQRNIAHTMRVKTISDTLASLTENDDFRINTFTDALGASPWDGVARVEEMFLRGWGCADTPYHRALGLNWLPSLVKRATEPGCKADQMIVLIGDQGIGKSRSLAALGGQWYLETSTPIDNKDFLLAAHRYLVVDLAEMAGFKYAEMNHVKALLTTTTDVIRAPYGRVDQRMPRRFVCVSSTNDETVLRDTTGNRRFLPVVCGDIDIAWIKDNRMQLFAEAMAMLQAGAQCWVDQTLAAPVQAAHTAVDPWMTELASLLQQVQTAPAIGINGQHYSFIATSTLCKSLGVPMERQNAGTLMRVSSLMKRHFSGEWEKYTYNSSKTIMVDGQPLDYARGYRKPRSLPPATTNVVTIKAGSPFGD